MDSKVKLSCPHCGVAGVAPANLAGRRVKCKNCGNSFEVPSIEAPREPVTPPTTGPESTEPEVNSSTTDPQAPASPSPPVSPGGSPPTDPPPPPQTALPSTGAEKPVAVRANRVLAGKTCAGCATEIMLGEEVVRCDQCKIVSHSRCWDNQGGCPTRRCSSPAGPDPTAGSTRPCPACAEQIPVDVKLCPFCAEHFDGMGGGDDLFPITFTTGKGELFVKKWTFTANSTELVGTAPGFMPEIRIPREHARSEIVLGSRKMTVEVDGKKRKLTLDDIGHMAVSHFIYGQIVPRTSVVARDAFIASIVGIFCCQIVLGIYALVRASQAKEMMNSYPEAITGRGLATAAQIIGAFDLVLFVLYIFVNAMGVQSGAY